MNSKIKINENVDENMRVIEDSYNDYITIDNDREREIMARHIARSADGFIKNRGGDLEDWLRVFADEDIVISKLKAL
jgi:low affinity Fe/Cu permease